MAKKVTEQNDSSVSSFFFPYYEKVVDGQNMKTRRKLVDVKPFPCRCHPIDNATSSLGSSFKTDIKIIFQFSFVLHSICFVSLNALSITKATHKT